MPGLVDTSDLSAADRPLAIVARRDLVVRQQRYQGRLWWILKDPLALAYHQLHDEEYAVLQMLDGRTSLRGIKDQFERRFSPTTITISEIQQFLDTLHRLGLVVADAPGQAHVLRQRQGERRRRELLGMVTNLLSLRFRGVDPDRFLTWLHPYARWCFSPAMVALVVAVGLAALLLVVVQYDVFRAKLPTFHQFFTPWNAVGLALTLSAVKVLHELGHGLACKHFGGECHEVGLMLLVFSPCLYCNVSDSWMLPSKWQRIAVSAAGMYVELVLASLATFIWWYSQPGLLHNICLSVMFVCSVGTVLFNGNPLLRYDGYYILADFLEIPNLRQKSSQILQRIISSACLGMEPAEDLFLPQRHQGLFALYVVASEIYRWVVTLSIVWFLFKFFEPYRLEVIGRALGLVSLYSLVVHPLWRLARFLRVPGQMNNVKRKRLAVSLGIATVAALFVCCVPLPHRVLCPFEVQPRDASSVYAESSGTLAELYVRPGDAVRQGQQLARLHDVDLELAVAELTRQRDRQSTQLDVLRRQRFGDQAAGAQVPELQQALAGTEEQLARKQAELNRLTLTASVSGTVLPPVAVTPGPVPDGQLPAWTGSPLERRNLGCFVTAGSMLCQIGDRRHMWAELVVDQTDIELIQPGLRVRAKLDQSPHDVLEGQVSEVARTDLKVASRQLSNKSGGELASQTDAAGQERPINASYLVRVPLDSPSGMLRPGSRGVAKVDAAWQTLAQRALRYLRHTFHFRL